MKKIRDSRLWIFGIFLLVMTSSCKEPVEGCQDVDATNYSVSADETCADEVSVCCEYPDLTIEVAHRIQDSIALSFDSTYMLGTRLGKLNGIRFYFSDFSFFSANSGEKIEVEETLDLNTSDGTKTFKDDFALINRQDVSFNYILGTIRGVGSFDSIRFFVGLNNGANAVLPDEAPDEHPLARQSSSMYDDAEASYISNQIKIIPDTSNIADTLSYSFLATELLTEVVLPYDKMIDRGFDVTVPLKIDYQKWFTGIDFVTLTEAEIRIAIVSNIAKAFSINE